MDLTKDIVAKEKQKIKFPSKIFINGIYKDSASGKSFNNTSPIDGKLINTISFAQKEDVDIAVKVSRKIFEQGSWSKSAPSHRKKVLLRFADLLEKHRLELALFDTIDVGKTINDISKGVSGSLLKQLKQTDRIEHSTELLERRLKESAVRNKATGFRIAKTTGIDKRFQEAMINEMDSQY